MRKYGTNFNPFKTKLVNKVLTEFCKKIKGNVGK